jgi:NADPH:quinone reductase-like Zn-dependent oxidoreductase
MKAAVYFRYGPPNVVEIREVEKPVPKPEELLIRVRATTVTSGDARLRAFRIPGGFWLPARLGLGIFRPRDPILGFEFSGDVEAVGAKVAGFKPGDAVFGGAVNCHAEYICVSNTRYIAIKPANLSYEEAAAVAFGGVTALTFLRDRAKIQPGERALINGASGAVGVAAVQLARHFGAEVTGVCSAANADLVRSLGARKAIDYSREDFTRSGETYDIIMDNVGNLSFGRAKRALKKNGRLLLIVAGLGQMLLLPIWTRMKGGKQVISGIAGGGAEHVRFLAGLIEAGRFKPVIDCVYPFEEIAAAHAHVDTGRKKGNVVITVQP